MTTSLSTPSLLELIELFERASQPILDSEGRPLHGVPAWSLRADAALSKEAQTQWTQRIGFAGHYPAERGDESLPVELEEDDDPQRYRYRCPETFRMKTVPASQVAIYEVIPARLLSMIADLLDIPRALQGGIHRPAIEGALWCLGRARIGSSHTDVWFARGLTRRLADIFRYFHAMTLPDQGLVLTSSPPLAEFIPPPRNYRFAFLGETLIADMRTPGIDRDLLQRILAAPADAGSRPNLTVQFDEYTRTLRIRSNPKPWVIRGDRQAAAVRYMYTQALHDRWELSAAEILGAAYPNRTAARSLRIQNLFSGNVEWEDYIARRRKGFYGFRVD